MNAAILSIGEELTSGQCVDTNAAWLSRSLTARGLNVVRHVTVPDNLAAIAGALAASMTGVDLLVATGGLGPTPDDLTRQALADALGVALEHSAEAEAQIRGFFARWGRPVNESNLVQAKLPRGCSVLDNSSGTAPGIKFVGPTCRVFVLPGVPAEMKLMFERRVAPGLSASGTVTLTESLRCFGLSEAALGERLADVMVRTRNPLVGVTAAGAILTVSVKATACRENEARGLLHADLRAIRARLGTFVFGTCSEGLEHAVAGLLRKLGRTVATAESCTGGLLAKRLTDVPGATAFFVSGVVCYANRAKVDLLGVPAALIDSSGAVSKAVAKAMAERCRAAAASDFSLAITGIAGPSGGCPPEKPVGLVFIAVSGQSGCEVRRCCFGEHLSRCEIRSRSVHTALDMLRNRLLRLAAA